jgi:Na+/H+ antiporter NhaD/arsenite permease-like protein
MLSGKLFFFGCAIVAALIFFAGRVIPIPLWLLGTEVSVTILGLFVFGSFKYQIHKNALTFGMLLVMVATFAGLSNSSWSTEIAQNGWSSWAHEHLLSFHGLDELIHADTMLFLLGLTCFVSVIAQTRLLEVTTFALLRRFGGAIVPTLISVTAFVAFASGIFDGVSMIGLTIRTLVIVMMLAAAPKESIRYAVMVCTAVTTVCGVWLAYGEPPNLIMKANLYPVLDNFFFLKYCAPVAIVSYVLIAYNLRRKLGTRRVNLERLDIVDTNLADVRFFQAGGHGEVFTPVELVEAHEAELGHRAELVLEQIRNGESLGLSLVKTGVPEDLRKKLLGRFVIEDLADTLDSHYVLDASGKYEGALAAQREVEMALTSLARLRKRVQIIGVLSVLPFLLMLVLHGFNHQIPLFLSSFAGFAVAFLGIMNIPKMRDLALRESYHEYAEYFFLFPLFLSITLLTSSGFFTGLQTLIHTGMETLGTSHVAVAQFFGSTVLSAILDNNVVADFASRALTNLDMDVLKLFAMAQIAGYALGGCWTHIGCAQSVVAYAFIQRDVDAHYTPLQWIKEMTPVIIQVLLMITVLIYVENLVFQ